MSKKIIAIIIVITAVLILLAGPLAVRGITFRSAPGKIVYNKELGGTYSRIYVTNAAGMPTTQLSANDDWDVGPVLSPDGTKIAFECHNPDFGLCIMNSDGTNRVRIDGMGGRPMSPNWSPDNQKVVFESSGIYVVNSDGSSLTQIASTDGDTNYWEPVWSPDEKKIAYTVISGENWDIFTMNSDGSEQRNLTNHPASDSTAFWSRDGSQIFFVSDRSGDDEVYRMKLDGTEVINLTNSPQTNDDIEAISPNGQQIVFSVHQNKADPEDIDLYVMNTDGSGKKRLTENSAFDSYATWSPDGKYIAFISGRSGEWLVYVMNADGEFQTKISSGASAADVSWRP